MKLFEKKQDNRGFSLVELIIVIAIMAILVGIVGTQVIPYLNKSREAKDLQIISSYSTAAVTAYAENAEKFAALETAGNDVTISVYTGTYASDPQKTWKDDIITLSGYAGVSDLKNAMSSKKGSSISDVTIKIDWSEKTITATATDGTNDILEPCVSPI